MEYQVESQNSPHSNPKIRISKVSNGSEYIKSLEHQKQLGTDSKFFENKILQNMEENKLVNSGIYSEGDDNQQSVNLISSSKGSNINIFGNSLALDSKILEELFYVLSNKVLYKQNKTEYFDEIDIFDQEWNFPHNQNQIEFQNLLENENNNLNEDHKIELYKRNIVDLQIQLRTLSHYFVKVDQERIFFRDKLVQFLENKIEKTVVESESLKKFVLSHFENESENFQLTIEKLTEENKKLLNSLSKTEILNKKLKQEVQLLTNNLNEKRKELKNYRFNRENKDDPNITGTTTNSNNAGKSGENSYVSRDYIHKLTINPKMHNVQSQRLIKHNSNFIPSNMNQSNGTFSNLTFYNLNQTTGLQTTTNLTTKHLSTSKQMDL